MKLLSTPSLRRSYQEWVEDQIESFKETVTRADLMQLADEVVTELTVHQSGQYQLTEILLLEAVDRKIFQLLDLPAFRSWATTQGVAARGTAES